MWTARGAAVSLLGAMVWSGTAIAAAPAPYQVTPQLVAAAKKEGKVVWYSSTDVQVAEKLAQAFEAKYPGIKVQVERSGAERIFQRINQEYGSKIYNADVVETSDAVHFVQFKQQGWLQPAVPADVAKFWPKDTRDPDGQLRRLPRPPLGHRLQHQAGRAKEEAPKTHADLLDPQVGRQDGQGAPRLQRHDHDRHLCAEPGARLGLFREARQAERHAGAVLHRAAEEAGAGRAPVDGRRQRIQRLPAAGKGVPIEPVYAAEGTPLGRGQCRRS